MEKMNFGARKRRKVYGVETAEEAVALALKLCKEKLYKSEKEGN